MILPRSFLNTIAFYEYKSVESMSGGFKSVFTLHFKSFWKPRKKIVLPWRCTDINRDVGTYSETREARELKACLDNYFAQGS